MKKLFLKEIVLIAISIVTLNSCLKGGDDIRSETFYGTLTASGNNVLLKYSDFDVPIRIANANTELYTIATENYYGTPLISYLTINFDDEANNDISNYITATASNYLRVEESMIQSTLVDTATVLNKEILISDLGIRTYVNNYLFLNIPYPTYTSGQKNNLSLSFDSQEETETIEGNKVYNLFLRINKEQDGNGSTSSNEVLPYAFDISPLVSHARTSGNLTDVQEGIKAVYVKINYAKELVQDSTGIKTWGNSGVYKYIYIKSE